LTVESPSRAPSTRVVARLLSGSERRQGDSRGRFAGSLTTTWDDDADDDDEGGALVVTEERMPGLAATTVPPLRMRVGGTSQADPTWTVPGTTVVVPGAHATGTPP
jgi:hypothetical protein